jgi:branched-subunit amino acid ABC-type transport system permease component
MRLVNIAHGDLIDLSAYVAPLMVNATGMHPIPALVVVMPVIFGLGSRWGTRRGGMVLGIAQAIGAALSPTWQMLAGPLAFLLILSVRPHGLFPRTRDEWPLLESSGQRAPAESSPQCWASWCWQRCPAGAALAPCAWSPRWPLTSPWRSSGTCSPAMLV